MQNEMIAMALAWPGPENRSFTMVYLTPDLLSDHLFRNIGRATTIMPNITIAYT
jgi:hypothetical protein